MEEKPQEESQNKIEELEKQRDEYLDGWKRARADLINYKKEENERFGNLAKFSNEILMRELIIILDSFSLAMINLKDGSAEKKGVELIKIQFEDVLKKQGLENLKTEVGEKFDPLKHEAMSEIESDGPDGSIAEVLGSGYSLNGRIIRPIRVKISKSQN